MKKMILVAVVFMMTQVSMAAGLTAEKIETRVKPYTERIERAKLENGGNFTKDAKVMKLVSDALDKITRDAGVGETSSLIKLINNDSGALVLKEIARLSSIIGDKAATSVEVSTAKKALELLTLSAKSIELLSKNEAHAKEQQEKVELAVKIVEKIAKFNDFTSQKAKDYAAEFEKGLTEGNSPRDAMKMASKKINKEIKEDELKDCVL